MGDLVNREVIATRKKSRDWAASDNECCVTFGLTSPKHVMGSEEESQGVKAADFQDPILWVDCCFEQTSLFYAEWEWSCSAFRLRIAVLLIFEAKSPPLV